MTKIIQDINIGVAAIIKKSNKFLLVKRKKHLYEGGLWSFPGGHIEKFESVKDAIIREVKEETGLKIKKLKFLNYVESINPPYHIIILVFKGSVKGKVKISGDVEDFRWAPLKNLVKYPLRHGMKDIMKKLQRKV